MKIPIRFNIVCFVLLFLFLGGTSVGQTSNTAGNQVKGRFVNDLLNFELTPPQGWLEIESEEEKAAKTIGLNALKTGDSKTDAAIEKSFSTDEIIFFATEKPMGSIENAAFGMSITKLPTKGYLPRMLAESYKSTLLKNPKNRLVRDISLVDIGRRSWANIELDLDFYGRPVHSDYFVTVIDEYALVATMSYNNDQQHQKMKESLLGIRFTNK